MPAGKSDEVAAAPAAAGDWGPRLEDTCTDLEAEEDNAGMLLGRLNFAWDVRWRCDADIGWEVAYKGLLKVEEPAG